TAVSLGTLLFERSVEAAPKGLAALLTTIKIAAPASLAGGLGGLLLLTPRLKVLSALTAALVIGGAAVLLVHIAKRNQTSGGGQGALSDLAQETSLNNRSCSASNSETIGPSESAEPDPVKLMHSVAHARERITSGIIDFDVFTFGNVTR